jgi:phospholipid/cholesterol/gamma-HCH transport system substrate-binding protein
MPAGVRRLMVTQAPRRSAVAIAVVFALSCVGLIIFVWTQFGGTIPFAPQGYRVKAVFTETGLLVPNADVRVSGVNVGKVTAVRATGVNSLVTMDIERQYAPIPADTRAILREKTLLGEAYVELSTGTRSGRKLPDSGTIPRSQVIQSQQLDRVLNSFTPATQHNLQALLTGTSLALTGRGQDLNDAFGNFDPAVSELTAVVGVLNQQHDNLRSLISHGGTVLSTLGSRGAALESLVTAGDQVLSATAARNAALTATVDGLPPFLGQLRTSLSALNTTLGIAGPSLAALAPVAPLLTPALRGLSNLSGPVVSLLRSAPAVLRQAEVTLPDVAKFNLEFKPAVNALLAAAQQLAPVIDVAKKFRLELLAGMSNLAAMLEGTAPANTPSGSAHYLRALITIGTDSVFGQTQRAPGVRSNTYFAPGELANLNHGGLEASSCSNTRNTAEFPFGGANIPCRLQPGFPWGFGIPNSYYPHVRKAAR